MPDAYWGRGMSTSGRTSDPSSTRGLRLGVSIRDPCARALRSWRDPRGDGVQIRAARRSLDEVSQPRSSTLRTAAVPWSSPPAPDRRRARRPAGPRRQTRGKNSGRAATPAIEARSGGACGGAVQALRCDADEDGGVPEWGASIRRGPYLEVASGASLGGQAQVQ
jgi:hypothetical protein